MNLAIIGGSQSTGSSLLRQILNRHSSIDCMDESHLFCKPDLYANFEKNKNRIFKKGLTGLRSAGWHHLNGLDLAIEEQLELKKIFDNSSANSLQEFYSSLNKNEAKVFMDKTPANVFVSEAFLKLHQTNKVIITVRDPFDIMSSLYNRGMQLVDIVAIVKSSCIATIALKDLSQVQFVKYEELVADSLHVVKNVIEFLGLDYEEEVLDQVGSKNASRTKIEGWHYDETESIQQGAVGSFDKLTKESQQKLLEAFQRIQWHRKDSEVDSFLKYFAYGDRAHEFESSGHQYNLKRILIRKTFKNHAYNLFNNPLTISK